MNYRSNRPWATKVLLAFGALAVSYVLCGYTFYCEEFRPENKSCNPPNCDGRGWMSCPTPWTPCIWYFQENQCTGPKCKLSDETVFHCCFMVGGHLSSTEHTCKWVPEDNGIPGYCGWVYNDSYGTTCR